jgi:hypothetical protein
VRTDLDDASHSGFQGGFLTKTTKVTMGTTAPASLAKHCQSHGAGFIKLLLINHCKVKLEAPPFKIIRKFLKS